MPEIALVADISGVCSSGGTRVITMIADEAGQHEDVELENHIAFGISEVGRDDLSVVGHVVIAPVISSAASSTSAPSFTRCLSSSRMLRPNIWLA